MITLSAAPPVLSSSLLSLYSTRDALLGDLPIFVFYGPSTTSNTTHNNSRIQAHIYSVAGFQSFPRLTIAPTSPLYAAVGHLPADQRGDEVSRGLAVSLLSYFAGLSRELKASLRDRAATGRPNGVAPAMFDEMHAADLAAGMDHIEDKSEVANAIMSALSSKVLSWADVDVILPPGSIQRVTALEGQDPVPQVDADGLPLYHYGQYTSVIESFGLPAFLPTSKLQRAPSRPTAHSKTRTLSREQKISLRRELCELIDTENSYIGKIRDLVDSVSPRFNQNAKSTSVEAMFSQTLVEILKVNQSFYDEIQSITDDTENDAIKDIEGNCSTDTDLGSPITQSRRRDPTGTMHIAKALLRWFPKFMDPYQDYLRISAEFPRIINRLLENDSSEKSGYPQDFSEQQLRSALIEPVQRLPRYSLLIDNMVGLLPSSHPALGSLLKARDVITDICALDASLSADASRCIRVLRNMIADWPMSFSPSGRLVTAVDSIDLEPPYVTENKGSTGMLLLFTDYLVVLRSSGEAPLSARGIVAEVDRPTTPINTFPSQAIDKGLTFLEAFDLFDLQFSESEDGHLIRISVSGEAASILSSTSITSRYSTKFYSLLGPYDGKAARFSEEVVKARLEGRFSETTRESGRWALRSINPAHGTLGILLALSEELPVDATYLPHTFREIQIFMDSSKNTRAILALGRKTTIGACITTSGADSYLLEAEGADGTFFTDTCTSANLGTVLIERLGDLVRLQRQPRNAGLMQSYMLYNQTILESLPIEKQEEDSQPQRHRPLSPVKMITNLLSGVTLSHPDTPMKRRLHKSAPEDVPSLTPPTPSKSTTEDPFCSKVTLVESAPNSQRTPLALLEDTFAAYAVALRSRSGNIVGKILRSRASADELAVNELYNTLLEEPSRLQVAAEASIDVLFAAFEKFLKRAWREGMGPLLPTNILQSMQSAFDAGKPVMFKQQVRRSLENMSPQNHRAFAASIKLLLDLLDASGNDGDRGALMASFAEALIFEGHPHDYIMLLDRLVDDYDSIFDETFTGVSEGDMKSNTGSLTRTRSFNTGSISSNASSLRKKFGFGTLTRENSKNESESKVSSIWRTLSKNAKSPGDSHSQPASLSKASGPSLVRPRSTDIDQRMLPPLRPVSRDRPTTSGSTSQEESRSRPGSSHLNTSTLSSIGENTPTKPTVLPRRKRRSSLSDILSLKPDPATAWSPLQPRRPLKGKDASAETPPLTPSPVKQSPSQQTNRHPLASGLPKYAGSPQRKENSPIRENSPPKSSSPVVPRTLNAKTGPKPKSEEVVITSYSPQKRQASRTGIPTPNRGLSEPSWPPNGNNTPPKKVGSSPQKLRMQSPQKIRERISQEQKTLARSDDSFQAEMNKIGEELATYKLHRSPTKPRSTVPATQSTSRSTPTTPTLDSLGSQLSTLTKKLSDFTTSQGTSLSSLSIDVESSLLVSERKLRKLDELYREANAENEALYERFNDELGKILGKVRKGEGVDEMRNKMKEAQDEAVRLKKENARLKREAVGLRSLMKGD